VEQDNNTLNDLLLTDATATFHNIQTVSLKPDFKDALVAAYNSDKHLSRVKAVVETSPDNTAFRMVNDLLWLGSRLCIPKSLVGDIFDMVHDQQYHIGYHRMYAKIASHYYIHKLDKHLRRYIYHCKDCRRSQTTRHKPYGQLQPIISPAIPFHTVTIDFVSALPSIEDINMLLVATCKFSKSLLIIQGYDTLTADAWAHRLLDALLYYN